MKLLVLYLTERAKEEGVSMELDESFFVQYFRTGCRTFFGVIINDHGNLLYDAQEPRVNFLKEWLQRNNNNNGSSSNNTNVFSR